MKVLSLDAAYSKCDEMERGLRRVNGVRFAVPASFSAVFGVGVWSMGVSAGGATGLSSAEWIWFTGF